MLTGRHCSILLCATRGMHLKRFLNPCTAACWGGSGVGLESVADSAVLAFRSVPGGWRSFSGFCRPGVEAEVCNKNQERSLSPLPPPTPEDGKATDGSEDRTLPSVTASASSSNPTRDTGLELLRWQKDEGERQAVSNPGFSFSAAGLLFPYHLGVTQCLVERGFIGENTPLAGSSAGALVCAVIVSGISMHDAMLATKELSRDCRANGTAFRLGAVLRESLDTFLPHDAHIKASGRIRVCITQVFRSPKGKLIDQFESKADLIDALHTSCFIPGYIAPRPVTMFRESICIDGGFTMFMPPTAADVTIRVCSFSASWLHFKNVGISPDCNPIGRASQWQLIKWAMEPAEDGVLDDLFELGYKDASVWASQHDLSEFTKCITDEMTVSKLTVH